MLDGQRELRDAESEHRRAADDLVKANAKAKSGGPIAVSDRNAKREDAERLVDQLVTYEQVTVRAQTGSPAAATATIVSAGLPVWKITEPSKAPLAAKHGRVSGEVVLVVRRRRRTPPSLA